MNATLKDIDKELQRGRRATQLLNQVLNWALANRGTKSEFVRCYTYGKSYPRTLADVKAFLREPLRKDYKIVEDEASRSRVRSIAPPEPEETRE